MRRILIQAVAVLALGGAVAGLAVRPATFEHTPTPDGTFRYDERPAPSPLMPAGHHPEPKVNGRQAKATTTPWSEGWQFRYRSVCIESGITGAPLANVASMFRVKGIEVFVRFGYGHCAEAGFDASQRIVFSYYTAADKVDPNLKGACAYTQAGSYGFLTSVYVRVNVLGGAGGMRTACGDVASGEWQDVFGHEAGHSFGLSHEQPYVTSIMRDGRWTSATDVAYLGYIYDNNPKLRRS
jgi:hypothetical protein